MNNTFEYLHGFDIVAVSETKLLSLPRHLLPDHTLHSVPAERQHKAGQGLLLGVRTALNYTVQPWFPSCGGSGTAWLQLTQRGSSEQFFIGVCYVPTVSSPQLRTKSFEQRLAALRREVSAASAKGTVILGGDFNARFSRSDHQHPQPHDEGLPPRGCSCGYFPCACAADDRGRQLEALCAATRLALCTGRAPGDRQALPSRMRGSDTASRLDHIFISRHALSSIASCFVPQNIEARRGSDHCPLQMRLRLFSETSPKPVCITGRPLQQIKWEPQLRCDYAACLTAPAVAAQLAASDAAATAGDINAADELLTAAVHTAALTAGARRTCPGMSLARSRRPNHHAPWFDIECRAASLRYWKARRQATAAGTFEGEEQRFKALTRRKRRRWQLLQLQQHLHDLRRNPRALWQDFNRSRSALPPSLASPSAWAHFQQLLAAHQTAAGCHLPVEVISPPYSQAAADQLNCAAISADEVIAALPNLHNGRASGLSELPAEFYRYASAPAAAGSHGSAPPHLLAPVLAKIFTAAFAAGTIPISWSTAAVTPLHKKGDPTDTANYRPVAVGVPLARLYASVLNGRVTPYFEAEYLRAQGQAGFRARRSINHNLFALQQIIDKHCDARRPLYCCFVDLTAAFDRVPRHLLWQRLESRGVSGTMLAAVQAFYRDPKVVMKVSGHVGNSVVTTAGVRQGCPLSPTLFGIYIDALEGWLRQQAPDSGVPLCTASGISRLLPALIYADDIALVDSAPAGLQRLLDALAAFCAAVGLDVSFGKTKVLQLLPQLNRQPPPLQHSFKLGACCLENVDSYKYLGVYFHNSGNPADYMPAARRNLDQHYSHMRRQYCGLTRSNNLQLQLRFFEAIVTSSAMFGGELWGVHPRTAAERKKMASQYTKHLKNMLRLPVSTHNESLFLELGWLSLPDRWLQCAVRFWNQLLALPADDLYRDMLYDSVANNVGFAKGLQQACQQAGFVLDLEQQKQHLQRLDCTAIMQQVQRQQRRSLEAADVDPRTCPSEGAMACKYWRWFRRSDMQQRVQLRQSNSLFTLPASAGKVTKLLRFRLGCQKQLAVVNGRYNRTPRSQRFCPHCSGHLGDERHLVFECTTFDHIRHEFSHLFQGHHTLRSFMNQDCQVDVLHFICQCLDYDALLANIASAFP